MPGTTSTALRTTKQMRPNGRGGQWSRFVANWVRVDHGIKSKTLGSNKSIIVLLSLLSFAGSYTLQCAGPLCTVWRATGKNVFYCTVLYRPTDCVAKCPQKRTTRRKCRSVINDCRQRRQLQSRGRCRWVYEEWWWWWRLWVTDAH